MRRPPQAMLATPQTAVVPKAAATAVKAASGRQFIAVNRPHNKARAASPDKPVLQKLPASTAQPATPADHNGAASKNPSSRLPHPRCESGPCGTAHDGKPAA